MNSLYRTWDTLRLAGPLRERVVVFNRQSLARLSRYPINDKIKHKHVHVVNEQGKLGPPTPLDSVLSSIDLTKYFVALVTENQPIVKILSKKEEYIKAKARKEADKANARHRPEQKEIQMTWGVAAGDIAHKLDKARKELEKKNLVDLIFAPKKKTKPPPPHECKAKADDVVEMLKDVGHEWKPRTLHRALMTLHLRGTGVLQTKKNDPES